MPLRPYPLSKNEKFLIHFPLHLIPATEEKTWPALSSRGQSFLKQYVKQSLPWLMCRLMNKGLFRPSIERVPQWITMASVIVIRIFEGHYIV